MQGLGTVEVPRAPTFSHAGDFTRVAYFVLIAKKLLTASQWRGDDICTDHYKMRLTMQNLNGKVAFVTGGSRGIG
ncbi:MAG TPA: hypothetical protein DCR74_14470, partial [Achromobacter sp.]|nr:hypothetical protein [Achromobacter sp.]